MDPKNVKIEIAEDASKNEKNQSQVPASTNQAPPTVKSESKESSFSAKSAGKESTTSAKSDGKESISSAKSEGKESITSAKSEGKEFIISSESEGRESSTSKKKKRKKKKIKLTRPKLLPKDIPVAKPRKFDSIDEEGTELILSDLIKEYLPWFSITIAGFILLLVAVILLAVGTGQKVKIDFKKLKLPSWQGNFRVYTVDDKPLKYTPQLKYIGNLEAKNLRKKLEPKFQDIYKAASLNVDSVLVLAFKYGKAGSTNLKVNAGRSAASSGTSIVVRHWVYLKENTTLSVEELTTKVKKAATDAKNIGIDINQIKLYELTNITRVQALTVLSQHGFFRNELSNLDMATLTTLGLVALQKEGEGACSALSGNDHLNVYPSECTDSTETYVGLVCSFNCTANHYLMGSPHRICLTGGRWSGSPAKCSVKCPPIGAGSDGNLFPKSCSTINSTIGQMCFVQCPQARHLFSYSDTQLTGSSYFRECQENGKWSGNYGFCKAKCPSINIPSHFNILAISCAADSSEGDICTITCQNGYYFDGGGTIQQLSCDANGKWDKTLLQCKSTCPTLSPGSEQTIVPPLCMSRPVQGTKCSYSCSSGYKLNGTSMRICTSSGWSATSPTCVRVCPQLESVTNGIYMSSIGDCMSKQPISNTKCQLMCDLGFFPSETYTTCDGTSGLWNPANLECKRICPPFKSNDNGVWSPENCPAGYGKQCTLTCKSGYSFSGTLTINCNFALRKWDATPGLCAKTCSSLSNPSNGNVGPSACTSNPISGTACVYSCSIGYEFSGDKTWTCLDDGSWDKTTTPTCSISKHFVIYGSTSNLCITLDEGSNVMKSSLCSNNDAKNRWIITSLGQLKNVHTGKCLSQGTDASQAIMVDCADDSKQKYASGFPSKIINQIANAYYLTQGPQLARTVEFSPVTSFDDDSSNWWFRNAADNSVIKSFIGAKSNNCPLFEKSDFMTTTGCDTSAASVGSTCTITCNSGYQLDETGSSNRVITCRAGAWDILPTVRCYLSTASDTATCPAFPTRFLHDVQQSPSNCLTGSPSAGTVCTFSCSDDEHYVDGSEMIACTTAARWSRYTAISCKPFCSALFPSANSRLASSSSVSCGKGNSRNGDVCLFDCNDGYFLQGRPFLTCTESGRWDGEVPQCTKMCSDLSFDDAKLQLDCTIPKKYNKYFVGTECNLKCQGDLSPQINESITCEEDGTWKGITTPHCDSPCGMFKKHPNVTVKPDSCTKRLSHIGTKCTSTCESGYHFMDGSRTKSVVRTCGHGMKWSGSISFCTEACSPLSSVVDDGNGYYEPSSCSKTPQLPGSICNLRCQGLFQVHGGVASLKCVKGIWETYPSGSSAGRCLSSCKSLSKPNFGTVTPYYCVEGPVEPGTQCVIECPSHMERVGPGVVTCTGKPLQTSGTGSDLLYWSDSSKTQCVAKCPPLQTTSSLFVYPESCETDYQVEGSFCSFECLRGMSLFGSVSLICKANGMWSDVMPICYRTCLGIEIFAGNMYCSAVTIGSAAGYDFLPGSRCNILCDSGYTVYLHNEITCSTQGIWYPDPFCQANSETFSIFQNIENSAKCLTTAWNTENVGSDWILSFVNSSDSCLKAKNNAMWLWLEQTNIKHAQTGLCITVEHAKKESLIVLEPCDTTNELQHWECDLYNPYRVILKGTSLGIDTTYEKAGPILEETNRPKSNWLTFNKDLESVASICSYKKLGTCPPLNMPNLRVTPSVCATNEVLAWQECKVSCDDGYTLSGGISNTTCLLTGVWENIENARCVKKCPRAPAGGAATYDPASCGDSTSTHTQICTASCMKHVKTIDMEDSYEYVCNDGEWSGATSICGSQCYPRANALALCEDTVCIYMCEPGLKISGDSRISECDENGDITESPPSCVDDTQFLIQAKSINGPQNTKICLTLKYGVSNRDSTSVETMKTICNIHDSSQYWRWDGDKLQHVFSRLCLSAEAGDWSIVNGSTCGNNNNQKFACLNNLFPYHIKSKINETNVIDFGMNTNNAPAVTTYNIFSSGGWLGVAPKNETSGTICSFKESGVCPALDIGPKATFEDANCAQTSTASSQCNINCNSGYQVAGGSSSNYALTCKANGEWSGPLQACIVSTASSDHCGKPIHRHNLMVNPDYCFISSELALGTMCRFSCEPGYNLIGTSVIFCESSSTWYQSKVSPACEAFCPGLTMPMYGSVSPAKCNGVMVSKDSVCTQSCNRGYKAVGQPQITCNEDGTWSGDVIACAKSCPLLKEDPYLATTTLSDVTSGNKKVVTSNDCVNNPHLHGHRCTFSCPTNYYLFNGDSVVTCQADGTWSSSIPRCIQSFACPSADLTNVQAHIYEPVLEGNTITAGTAVYLTCNNDFVIDGDEIRVCMKNTSWGGNGPPTPVCSRLCSPLSKKFGGTITPVKCTTEYVENAVVCTLTCKDGTTTSTSTCQNGAWSSNFNKCPHESSSSEAAGTYEHFLIISRTSKRGCFYPGNNNTLQWAFINTCSANDDKYLWKWTDSYAIMNVKTNKCLKPVNSSNEMVLGVVACNGNQNQVFGCGNPESSVGWAMLYYLSTTSWKLSYSYGLYSGVIDSVTAEEISSSLQSFSPYTFETIQAVALADPEYPQKLERSICSFQCGGKLTSEPASGFIASPGFIRNEMYRIYTSCVWTFEGYGDKITLTLLELDLEGKATSKNPCEKDCIQVYKGLNDKIVSSELAKTYTGNNIYAYDIPNGGDTVTVGLGHLYVKFKSDGNGNNTGFAMSYLYSKPATQTGCGNTTVAWNIPSLADEPPLGAKPSIKQWPWIVSIRETAERKGKAYHRCSGVLIDDTTVISAAHCARFAVKALTKTDGITIGVGQSSQFAMDDDLQEGRSVSVDRVFIHPEYDHSTRRNDIAVWKLMTKVNFTDSVKPICAPLDGYSIQNIDSNCYAAGWTQLDNGVPVINLISYRMSIYTTSYCEKFLGLDAPSGFVCANYVRLDTTVASGSEYSEPLMCLFNNQWYVAGVASHTRIGTYLTRRLYTSIHDQARWIKKVRDITSRVSYRSQGLERLNAAGASDIKFNSTMWFEKFYS